MLSAPIHTAFKSEATHASIDLGYFKDSFLPYLFITKNAELARHVRVLSSNRKIAWPGICDSITFTKINAKICIPTTF